MKKKVLVNGANGFLGTHVIRQLKEAGWDIRASDIGPKPSDTIKELGIEYVQADLSDQAQANKITFGCSHVINVAGLFRFDAKKEELYKANATCTRNMCQAALESGVDRFVHVATIGVYGKFPMGRPITEDQRKRPKNDYEKSKKKGEDIAFQYWKQYQLPVVSLRPTVIYGPGSRYPIALLVSIMAMLRSLGVKQFMHFDIPLLMTHVHVVDVARALVWLLDHGQLGEPYHIADDTPSTWSDLMAFIQGEFGIGTGKVYKIPSFVARLGGYAAGLIPQKYLDQINESMNKNWGKLKKRQPDLPDTLKPQWDRDFFTYVQNDHLFNTSKLRGTGFTLKYPNTWEGLRETVKWYEEHGWIPRRSDAEPASGKGASA